MMSFRVTMVRWSCGAALVVIILAALYLAALGPLVSLADRGYISGQFINQVYAPIPRSVGMKVLRAWSHFDPEHFRDVRWEDE